MTRLVHSTRQIFGLTIGILCTPARHCLKQMMRASCFSGNAAGTQNTIARTGRGPLAPSDFFALGGTSVQPGSCRKHLASRVACDQMRRFKLYCALVSFLGERGLESGDGFGEKRVLGRHQRLALSIVVLAEVTHAERCTYGCAPAWHQRFGKMCQVRLSTTATG